jgi:hypothetical protein
MVDAKSFKGVGFDAEHCFAVAEAGNVLSVP